ncbi:MAG: helix-turn-helix domain-containing protein [Candidatus Sulfotelmatobacter sp.]
MSDLMTVEQVAEILQVSPDTVLRRFARVKGVVDIGTAETPKRRRYRVLRIPRVVVERWVLEHGGRITVPADIPIPKPKSGIPKTPHEDDLIRDLATVANQHGDEARKTLDRIARHARAMTFIPEDRWDEVIWLDDEED